VDDPINKNYFNRCKVQFSQNPRKFYNFVITKRVSTNYSSSLSFENLTIITDQAKADLFAKFFRTTYSTLPNPSIFFFHCVQVEANIVSHLI